MGLLDSLLGAAVQGMGQGGGAGAAGGAGGMLGNVLGSMLGGGGQAAGAGGGAGGNAALLNIVLGMLGNDSQGGGLGGLMAKFQQAGMGDVMKSWVSTGANAPISGDQLSQVLGGDTLAQIASQLGVSQGDAAGQLSEILPEVVDRLTPSGEAPAGGLGDMGDLLGMLLKR